MSAHISVCVCVFARLWVCTYIWTYSGYKQMWTCGFFLYASSAKASTHTLLAQYNRMSKIDVVLYLCVISVSRKGIAGPWGQTTGPGAHASQKTQCFKSAKKKPREARRQETGRDRERESERERERERASEGDNESERKNKERRKNETERQQ